MSAPRIILAACILATPAWAIDDAINKQPDGAGFPWIIQKSGESAVMGLSLPTHMTIGGLAEINLKDGSVKYLNGATPDEAARAFYEAIGKSFARECRP